MPPPKKGSCARFPRQGSQLTGGPPLFSNLLRPMVPQHSNDWSYRNPYYPTNYGQYRQPPPPLPPRPYRGFPGPGSFPFRPSVYNPQYRHPPPPIPVPVEVLQEQKAANEKKKKEEERYLKDSMLKAKTKIRVEKLRDKLKQKQAEGTAAKQHLGDEEQPTQENNEPPGSEEKEEPRAAHEKSKAPVSKDRGEHQANAAKRSNPSPKRKSKKKKKESPKIKKGSPKIKKGSKEVKRKAALKVKFKKNSESPKRSRSHDNQAELGLQRREEFSKMSKNFKQLLLKKDKKFLHELINGPRRMKRKLMAHLVQERQEQVSAELTRMRYQMSLAHPEEQEKASEDNILELIETLEKDSASLAEVDLTDLPANLVASIESMIRQEKIGGRCEAVAGREDSKDISDADDDIVEIPVPEKHIPLIDFEGLQENDGIEANNALDFRPPDCDQIVKNRSLPVIVKSEAISNTPPEEEYQMSEQVEAVAEVEDMTDLNYGGVDSSFAQPGPASIPDEETPDLDSSETSINTAAAALCEASLGGQSVSRTSNSGHLVNDGGDTRDKTRYAPLSGTVNSLMDLDREEQALLSELSGLEERRNTVMDNLVKIRSRRRAFMKILQSAVL